MFEGIALYIMLTALVVYLTIYSYKGINKYYPKITKLYSEFINRVFP